MDDTSLASFFVLRPYLLHSARFYDKDRTVPTSREFNYWESHFYVATKRLTCIGTFTTLAKQLAGRSHAPFIPPRIRLSPKTLFQSTPIRNPTDGNQAGRWTSLRYQRSCPQHSTLSLVSPNYGWWFLGSAACCRMLAGVLLLFLLLLLWLAFIMVCWGRRRLLVVVPRVAALLLGPALLFIMIVMFTLLPYSFVNCVKRMTVVMPHQGWCSISCNCNMSQESGNPVSTHEEERLGVGGAPPGAPILYPAASILQLQYLSYLYLGQHTIIMVM